MKTGCLMLNREQNHKECDATGSHSSNAVRLKKNHSTFLDGTQFFQFYFRNQKPLTNVNQNYRSRITSYRYQYA